MNEQTLAALDQDELTIDDVAPKYLRLKDVTRVYGLKEGWIYQKVREGKLKSVRLSKCCTLFECASIESLIATLAENNVTQR
jgi:predicted DNA-binding transcriptional regulator AlpA